MLLSSINWNRISSPRDRRLAITNSHKKAITLDNDQTFSPLWEATLQEKKKRVKLLDSDLRSSLAVWLTQPKAIGGLKNKIQTFRFWYFLVELLLTFVCRNVPLFRKECWSLQQTTHFTQLLTGHHCIRKAAQVCTQVKKPQVRAGNKELHLTVHNHHFLPWFLLTSKSIASS